MGLDMYAFAVPYNSVDHEASTDFSLAIKSADATAEDENGRPAELAYWRKFNHLHGWMERLYRKRGGTETFNCVQLRLHPADLDELDTIFESGTPEGLAKVLEHTPGFFFGSEEIWEGDVTNTKEFISKARAALANNKVVFYDSWW